MHVGRSSFDLVIADLFMPNNECLERLGVVAAEYPDLPMLVVTDRPTLETCMAAARLPIRAYLLKPIAPERLLTEILGAFERAGPTAVAPQRRTDWLAHRWSLTARQRVVLAELVSGAANKEIAAHLGCSVRTVEGHLAALFRKAGVDSRGGLVARFWSGPR